MDLPTSMIINIFHSFNIFIDLKINLGLNFVNDMPQICPIETRGQAQNEVAKGSV